MITVIGEAIADLVPDGTGGVVAHPGGSPANVAVALARLGTRVGLHTHVGRDPLGDLLVRHVTASGATLLADPVRDGRTSTARVRTDGAGNASYAFDITWDPPAPLPLAPDSCCLHTGSIATTRAPGADAVRDAVIAAHGRATVSYDPNCRPSLMGDPIALRPRVEELVAFADVVKVGDEDLAWLYAGRAWEDVARDWFALGPALVVVTLGADGAWGRCAAGVARVPGRPTTIVDTVGAGDAFTAGMLDALRRRGLLDRPHAVGAADLEGVLADASIVAALTCARPGADPPTAAEVAAHRRWVESR